MRLTASNLVHAIAKLPRDTTYNYVNDRNAGRIYVTNIIQPEGPIEFKRFDPSKGQTLADSKKESISSQMIWRLANSIKSDIPVNVDRVFGASYNTRSVLEALLAHTPEFYFCKPGRLESMNSKKAVRPGHKHLIYMPDKPHENGVMAKHDTDIVISEINLDVVHQGIDLDTISPQVGMSIEEKRRHAQIQIALAKIGNCLNYRTWVAANDRHIKYGGGTIAQIDGVIERLNEEKVLSAYEDAVEAARLIDCIWFRNGRLMPAVMEIEHSTGIKSGLTRMLKFHDYAPLLQDIRWVIVAPDEVRNKVMEFANYPHFRKMKTKFFPYSAVDELYSLCERRNPQGITDTFLDCFMEECVE